MRHLTNCFGGAGACSGGTARTDRSVAGKPLRRWTRRYSSQRDEFYHAKQVRKFREPADRNVCATHSSVRTVFIRVVVS
jgi:hypothetical protein